MSRILAIEAWRATENPLYEVSMSGAVRNAKTGRRLKAWTHKSGHLYLNLGRADRRQVHRLVLTAFGGTGPEGMECRHLDGNHQNNSFSNLAWGTRQENVADLKATSGRFSKALLSDADAMRIKKAFTGKHGDQTRIAKAFGVSLSVVNRIIRGATYAHLGA